MKKILLICASIGFIFSSAKATNFDVVISGLTYSPDALTVTVGDVVNIQASGFHPLQQVSQATWDVNGSTPLPAGFAATANYSLPITAAMAGTTIYYVCAAHAANGMKGKITVNVVAGVNENRVRDYNFTVFPNPVGADSWLNISIKKAGKVTVTVYDMHGRLVSNLIDMTMQPGETTIAFDADRLQKGTYILLMRTNAGNMRKRIVVQ